MALILKRNGAPLSGALFVKNPRRRRKVRLNRAKRRALKFRTLGGLFAKANRRRVKRRRNGLAERVSNPRRRRASRKGGMLANLLRRFKMKKNAGYTLNRRRRGARRTARRGARKSLLALLKHNRRRRSRHNPMKSFRAHGKAIKFFARKNRRSARKNAGYMLNRRRRVMRKNAGYTLNRRRHGVVRHNPAFQLKILRPVQNLASKVPLAGKAIASSLGYLAFGAGALATHYYGMKAVRWAGSKLPAPIQRVGEFVSPVGYSLLGVTANVVLRKLPVPGFASGVLTENVRKNLGNAAMIVGAAIDLWRAFHGQSRDLGADDDFGAGYDLGDGGAYDIVGLGGIGSDAVGFGAIGEGVGNVGDYGDAQAADAQYSGPDLDGTEGEAALSGQHAYRATFGAPAKVASRKVSPYSRHAGKRGHRWGWLIKLVGWERFQQIAAMDPDKRCMLIARLRSQALATIKADLGGIGQGMAGIGQGMAGIGQGMSGLAEGLSGIGESGVADYGVMMAGSAY